MLGDMTITGSKFGLVGFSAILLVVAAFGIRPASLYEREFWVASNAEFRGWGSGFGVWGLGFRVWSLGFGVWGLGFGVWGLGFGV